MREPRNIAGECRKCQPLKAEYLSARSAVNRAKEDFAIGMLAILFPATLLSFIIGRYFVSLLKVAEMNAKWFVMILFVGALGIGGGTLIVRTFLERRTVYNAACKRLEVAISAVTSDCCDDCRDSLPAVL